MNNLDNASAVLPGAVDAAGDKAAMRAELDAFFEIGQDIAQRLLNLRGRLPAGHAAQAHLHGAESSITNIMFFVRRAKEEIK